MKPSLRTRRIKRSRTRESLPFPAGSASASSSFQTTGRSAVSVTPAPKVEPGSTKGKSESDFLRSLELPVLGIDQSFFRERSHRCIVVERPGADNKRRNYF